MHLLDLIIAASVPTFNLLILKGVRRMALGELDKMH
ncbi:hypothetical protein VIBHAR_06288 [Vibrio campbellii ATCC BAA-1116]|uniref:Uncharacterized protein n=1 Tax=Vibrio campbellii (strain ATCC BAA-1116) TaxID=2902295 RepID=A7N6H6_VIBC1|nr:hypothetical protein VIBHAR_06288 [Vibrio campbellii ATCC BAA-1116]